MEDYLSSTNYMGKPAFSEAREYDDDSCSEDNSWDSLVDLIANNCESSFCLSSSACQSYSSSLVSDDTFVDEELEDTATSPLQSPKLLDLNYLYAKSKETYNEENSQDHNGHISMKEGEVGIGLIETELRRRGLCLVPISMLLSSS